MTAVAVKVELLSLDLVDESPLNPRKTMQKEDLQELATDIKKRGVLQPILVRPMKNGKTGHYEIVFGARRVRASKLAGVETIPAFVREMGDAELLETALIENAKRTDIHPLEEADAYEQLHTKHKIGIDELAAKVGKSKAYVYARMKLCALKSETARAAFLADVKLASIALYIARVSSGLQEKAAKEVLQFERWTGGTRTKEPMTAREAAVHIQQHYMLRLADASFDTADATLVPAAGSCTACPKRTGNQKELFADVASADVCTDTVCFDGKKKASSERTVADAREKGQTVLSGSEAKKLFSKYSSELEYNAGYVAATARCYEDSKQRTYGAILGKTNVVLAPNPKGEMVKLYPKGTLAKALKDAGVKKSAPSNKGSSSGNYSGPKITPAQRAADEERREVKDATCARVVELVGQAIKKDPKLLDKAITMIAWEAFSNGYGEEAELVEERYGFGNRGGAAEKAFAKLPLKDRVAAAVEMMVADFRETETAAFGVDEKKVAEQIKTERAAAAKKTAPAAAAKKPLKGKPKE